MKGHKMSSSKTMQFLKGFIRVNFFGENPITRTTGLMVRDKVDPETAATLQVHLQKISETNYLGFAATEVLALRYGVGGKHRTFGQVAKVLGITRERARQIEIGAFRKILKS